MRTAIVTVVTDDFVDGARVLFASLRRHNPTLTADIVVFHNDDVAPLSAESCQTLTEQEPGIVFQHVDVAPYERLFAQRDEVLQTPARLIAAFVIIDAFRLTDFDRVVCLDSDMLVIGSLDELFNCDADFAAVTAVDETTGEMRRNFNTGVMVIGPRHLTGSTFAEITERTVMTSVDRERGKADQAVLNRYFETRPHERLAQKYNVTKRMVPDGAGPLEQMLDEADARILHFVGAKPWTVNWSMRDWGYESAEAMWWAEYFTISGSHTPAEIFGQRRSEILLGNRDQ